MQGGAIRFAIAPYELHQSLATQLVAAGFISSPVAHAHVPVIRAATVGFVRLAQQAAGTGRLRTLSFEVH
jgi:hypothetical protein